MHSLLAAWRVSLHRTKADWPIVAAAALISLLAATLLAAGPIYSSAVSEAGLHRKLADAAITDANVELRARVAPAEVEAASATVRALVGETVGRAAVDITESAVSDSFALPGQAEGEVRDLVRLGSQEGLADHASLVAGAWPVGSSVGAPVQVAVLEAVAATLELEVGETLALVSRVNASVTVDAVVTAIYRPADPAAPFWWNDPALLDGLVESEEYSTYGPLFTTETDLLARAGAGNLLMTWHAFPHFDDLRIEDVAGLRARMEALPGRVAAALPDSFATATTGMPALLAETERSLLASRTGVLLLLAQLAILAGYAIVLTADLIVDHRRVDTALLRSRGASTTQVGGLALAEAALLAIPAALIGPWLAALALQAFNVQGPLAEIGLTIDPRVSGDSFIAAGAAAAACAALLVMPAITAARFYAAERSGRSRPGTRTMGQRLGLDIALLALTVVGLWQLRLYGSPLTRTIQGTLGLDPLLVAAPAIGILAGSVVALRIVPLLARAADALAARGRSLVGSLGARQLARRPLRYTRTALLLMLAISMGVFSVAYGSTWAGSQRDQADFQVGADVRVTPAHRVDALPGYAIETAYRSIDGVATLLPVSRQGMRVRTSAPAGELLAVDAAAVAGGAVTSGGSGAASLASLAGKLAEARPTVPTIPLPGTPRRIALAGTIRLGETVSVRVDPNTGNPVVQPLDAGFVTDSSTVVPSVTVKDARGLLHRFTGAQVGISPAGWQFVVPLEASSAARQATTERLGADLDYPLELVGADLVVNLPFGTSASTGRVSLGGLAMSEARDGGEWHPLGTEVTGGWEIGWTEPGGPTTPISPDRDGGIGTNVGEGGPPAINGVDRFGRGLNVAFTPGGVVALNSLDLPAIVNPAFLEAVAADPGDRVTVPLGNDQRRLQIVGVVDAFPTTDPSRPAAMVDIATLSLVRYGTDRAVQLADEWWLDLDNGDAAFAAVKQAQGSGTLAGATVIGREETMERLSTDPIALATIGALSLGFVVAGLFAVIGLTVSAAVSARQRRTEFALLRALGLSPNQLSRWLLLENGSLVLVALLAGTGLGLIIGWVVLPFITVTQGGAIPFPPVAVEIPWPSVGVLELVAIVALGVTLVVLARSMRRAGVGSVLRMGEDGT